MDRDKVLYGRRTCGVRWLCCRDASSLHSKLDVYDHKEGDPLTSELRRVLSLVKYFRTIHPGTPLRRALRASPWCDGAGGQ